MQLPRLVLPMVLMMVLSLGGALVLTFSAQAALQGDKKAIVNSSIPTSKAKHDVGGYREPSHDIWTGEYRTETVASTTR